MRIIRGIKEWLKGLKDGWCRSDPRGTDLGVPTDQDWARLEYQAAQDSAQHHDTMLWTTTSIIWAGNLVLLGFTVNKMRDESLHGLFVVFGVLGLLLSIFVCCMQLQFRSIRNQKYRRCKELEKAHDLQQHRTLEHCKRSMTIFYVTIAAAFIVAWAWVISEL